jgi:hypothetical protein
MAWSCTIEGRTGTKSLAFLDSKDFKSNVYFLTEEAVSFSEMSLCISQTTHCNIAEDNQKLLNFYLKYIICGEMCLCGVTVCVFIQY